jgi:hypothetical protein
MKDGLWALPKSSKGLAYRRYMEYQYAADRPSLDFRYMYKLV